MKIILENIKPLSVNKVWQGRRFKTKIYQEYEREMSMLLREQRVPRDSLSGRLVITIIFCLKNAERTDFDNLLKPLLDILVKNDIIADDRFIWKAIIKKKKAKKDKIIIEIKKYD